MRNVKGRSGYEPGLTVYGSARLSRCVLDGRASAYGMLRTEAKGDVRLEGSTLLASGEYAVRAYGSTELLDSTVTGGSSGVHVSQGGEASFTMNGCTVTGTTAYGLYVSTLGTGGFSVKGNTFTGCGSYPVCVNLGGVTGRQMDGIRGNTCSGHTGADIPYLEGSLNKELVLPEGIYATGNISVYGGGCLTVPAGSVLLREAGTNFLVSDGGSLILSGTEGKPVVLTSYGDAEYAEGLTVRKSGTWNGFIVYAGGSLTAEYMEMRNVKGRSGYEPGLTVSGSARLSRCVLDGRASGYGMLRTEAKGDVRLEGCTLLASGEYAVMSYGSTELLDSTITGGRYGVSVSQGGDASFTMSGCTVTGTTYYGLYVYNLGTGVFSVNGNTFMESGSYPVFLNIGALRTGEELEGIRENQFIGSKYSNGVLLYGTLANSIVLPEDTYFCESITIPYGKTFQLSPGAKLLFRPNYGISLSGTLQALGTEEKKIVFSYAGDPSYVGAEEGSSTIEYWSGIRINDGGKLQASDCVFRYADTILNAYGMVSVLNSMFVGAKRYAVLVSNLNDISVNYCRFAGNACAVKNTSDLYAINASNNYWGSISGPKRQVKTGTFLGMDSYQWEGEGDKIEGKVEYMPFLGEELRAAVYFGSVEGAYAPTGNYSGSYVDLSYPYGKNEFQLVRTYNSQNDKEDSVFGKGWNLNYACKAYPSEDYKNEHIFLVELPGGGIDNYITMDEKSFWAKSSRNTLTRTEDGGYLLTMPDQTKYYYNASGYLVREEDAYGNAVTITVDAKGRPVKLTDALGRETVLIYQSGHLTGIRDYAGRTVTYEYDGDRLAKATAADGTVYFYEYTGAVSGKRLCAVKNAKGQTVAGITYELRGMRWTVESVTDAAGNTRTYSYDEAKRSTTITNTDGTTETQYYDAAYNIVGIVDGSGNLQTFSYFQDNNLSNYNELKASRDEAGNITSYERDIRGNTTKITYPDNGIETFQYDSRNNCIYHKDPAGVVTHYIYDESGVFLCSVIVELDKNVSYSQYGENDASKFAVTSYTYVTNTEECSLKGLIKTVTNPEGGKTTYTYNASGYQTGIRNAKGYKTEMTYDTLGRVLTVTTPEGRTTEYAYDAAGNILRKKDANGGITGAVYNELLQKVKEYTANGSEAEAYTYTYDAAGNLLSQTDPLGNRTVYTYDCMGRLLKEELPGGAVYTYTYDADGRMLTARRKAPGAGEELLREYAYTLSGKYHKTTETVYFTDTEAAETVFTYDYKNRLIEQKNPDGGVLSWSYATDGTLSLQKDALGNTTYYTYDALKNRTGVWTPFEADRYTYTGTEYDRLGNALRYTRSAAGTTAKRIPSGQLITVTCTYDALGNLLSRTDAAGTVSYCYDKDGRCLSETRTLSGTQSMQTEYTYASGEKPVMAKRLVENASLYTLENTGFMELETVYGYDRAENLIWEAAPDGTVTSYQYDAKGQCIRKTVTAKDKLVTWTSYAYDANGNVTKETQSYEGENAAERVTESVYDSFGRLEKKIDAEKGTTLYAYDRADRQVKTVLPASYREGLSIDAMEHLETEYDTCGREVRCIEVTQGKNQTMVRTVTAQYGYDRNGNRTMECDAFGNATIYRYNPQGSCISYITPETDKAGKAFTVSYTYDALGRKLTETTALGGRTSYTYDGADRLLSVTKGGAAETYTYDGMGNVLTKTESTGRVTTYTYNSLGKITSCEVSGDDTIDSYRETYQYHTSGLLACRENSMGTCQSYVYDGHSNPVMSVLFRTGGTEHRTERYTYDAFGNMLSKTDAEGNVTRYSYDLSGRRCSETVTVSLKELTKTTEYDANGLVLSETDVFGNKTRYRYDAFGRLCYVMNPDGTVAAHYTYDAAGQKISATDGEGHKTVYEYDRDGRVVSVTDAAGGVTKKTYDVLGNVLSDQDANGNKKTYTYDSEGRLLSVTSADGTKVVYTYDTAGNLLTQTDGNKNRTSYAYNKAGLVISKTEGSGDAAVTQHYTYFGNGEVATATDYAGTVTSYTYDSAGNLVEETSVSGSRSSTYTYVYDKANRLVSFTDGSGTTSYAYDALGRITEKRAPGFVTVTFGYDMTAGCEAGFHYETETGEAGTVKRWYDTAGRLVRVQSGDSVAEIAYYMDGARKSVTYGDGAKESYTFDGCHRVTSVKNTLADGSVQDEFLYTYDAAGNLKTKTEQSGGTERGTTAYTYDSLNRLASVAYPDGRTISYTYDGAGNRRTMTETVLAAASDGTPKNVTVETVYTYNSRNQLVRTAETEAGKKRSETVYTYDANGNRLTETKTQYDSNGNGDGGTTVLSASYDLHNQMVSARTAETSVRNTYNAQGFRVAKEVTTDGVTATSRFLYDGEHVIMEADGDGALTARNVYGGPLLFREVYSEAGAGDVDGNPEKVTYSYLYNAHGDVVTLLSGGEAVATYSYDAFGNLTGQTGEADNSVLYAGYQYDVETGLYYLNARMYDPVTARFLQADTYAGSQSDPLSLNLYTYCMNNPERYIDPSGHIAIELAVIVISAVVAGMAVEAGIQKFIEKKVCIDYNRIVGEGLFSGAVSAISFGTGNLLKCTIGPLAAKNALSTGTGLTAKTLAAALIANAAGGAASEAAEEMAHQFFVEGRTFSQIDYRQIGISAALGTVVSAGSTLAGAGIDRLKAKRAAKAVGGIVGNAEDALPARMQLQYFAGEADGSGKRGKVWDYSNGFNRELSNFNSGYEIKSLTEKDLYLVQLHSGKEVGDGRSLRYWTTFDEMNGISTIDDYMDKMALLSEWGPRDNVSIAKVPAGTKVKYVIGTAKDIAKDTLNNIEYRPGGGFQLLFEQFDEDWIIRTQKLSK